ncbi:response regulator, partial [Bacillus sp. WP8]|uniref:response regulator n=1 Tax=Bacillus sp. WP8 TaxID=756828 RepID=UPI00119E37F3
MIEDNESVCRMRDMFFEGEGFEGELVDDGLEGVNRFEQEENWDVVMLDVMLGWMDGVRICEKVGEISDVGIMMLR